MNLGGEAEGLELPPLDGASHIITHLFTVGPSTGGEALSYAEIAAWIDLTGNVLTAWEVETLRRLSVAYLSEREEAKDPERPPPFSPEAEPARPSPDQSTPAPAGRASRPRR